MLFKRGHTWRKRRVIRTSRDRRGRGTGKGGMNPELLETEVTAIRGVRGCSMRTFGGDKMRRKVTGVKRKLLGVN